MNGAWLVDHARLVHKHTISVIRYCIVLLYLDVSEPRDHWTHTNLSIFLLIVWILSLGFAKLSACIHDCAYVPACNINYIRLSPPPYMHILEPLHHHHRCVMWGVPVTHWCGNAEHELPDVQCQFLHVLLAPSLTG